MLLDIQAERDLPPLDCFVLAINDGAPQHLYPMSDRGPGILLAEQPQVFETLRQAAAALRKGRVPGGGAA